MENIALNEKKGVQLILHGNVQGVGFRYFAKKLAQHFDIIGWIKNNPDGTVEIQAIGENDILLEFIELCKKGPTTSKVTNTDIKWLNQDMMERLPNGFIII